MLTSAEIRRLAAAGLSAKQVAIVTDILERRATPDCSEPTPAPTPLSNAEKCRLYRNRIKSATLSDTTATPETTPVATPQTSVTPSPPSLPSLPPAPPIPPHTPTPAPAFSAPAREPRNGSKRQIVESDIREAAAAPLPLDLQSKEFHDMWNDWCLHRAELYRRDAKKRWSGQAARNTLDECARHGEELACMAIRAAIANGWQGLHWNNLAVAPKNGSAPPERKSFAQMDDEKRRADRFGQEAIPIKPFTLADLQKQKSAP